jgi:hypothetical protein
VALAQNEANWIPPHTPWGEPDLRGTWTNATITPFERPSNLADTPVLTEEEAASLEERATRQRESADRARPGGGVGGLNQVWYDRGTKVVSTRQASLVVDPLDGRVPVRPEVEKARNAADPRRTDSPELMSPWERCITRAVPGGMFPHLYNNGYQIVQTPGYVVIVYEMIHAARVIPTNGRPHLPPDLRFWDGDPVGRWEGQTLVVDVTNYNGKGWIVTDSSSRLRGIPQTDALHVVERFTRAGDQTIHYEVTVEDPTVYTRPWKVAMPLQRDDTYRMYEYACHEGNRAIEYLFGAARSLERDTPGSAPTKNR